jgi:O-antigen ligase
MPQFLTRYNAALTVFLCCVLLLAMLCSKLLLSMAIFGLVLLGLLNRIYLRAATNGLWRNAPAVALAALCFSVAATGFYSANTHEWWHYTQLFLPLWGLPFVWFWLPPLSRKAYLGVYACLVVLVAMAGISTLFDYYHSYAYYHAIMGEGRAIAPHLLAFKPIDHIRFSLLVALSTIAGAYLWQQNYYIKYRWERWLWLFCAIVALATLHILAVRSGLLGFYVACFALILRTVWQQKQWLWGGVAVCALCLLPYIAYQTVPSLRTKIGYSTWDITQFRNGANLEHSDDGGRFISWRIAALVGNQNPLFGVGYGDIADQTARAYAQYYPTNKKQLLPHNQFFFQYAGGGIIGVLALLLSLTVPLCYQKNYRDTLFLSVALLIFVSYLAEATLCTAFGVAIVAFFLSLSLNYSRGREVV